MRKLYILAIAALSALGAFAQPKAGTISVIPKLGLNLSNLTEQGGPIIPLDPNAPSWESDSKYKEGLVVGVDIQYQLTNMFALSLGTLYSMEGCRFSDISDTYKPNTTRYVYILEDKHTELNYIKIPLVAHFYVTNNLSLNAGVQLGFPVYSHHKATTTYFQEHEDGTIEYEKLYDKIELNHYKSDYDYENLKRTTITIPVGVSYEYSNIVIDARYNIPATRAGKTGFSGAKSRTYQFTVGYKFNL